MVSTVDLLSHVGDFARAIAPDMPGYGKADRGFRNGAFVAWGGTPLR